MEKLNCCHIIQVEAMTKPDIHFAEKTVIPMAASEANHSSIGRDRVLKSAVLLVVSLLLTVTVSILVYQNLTVITAANNCDQQSSSTEVQPQMNLEARFTIVSESGDKLNEDVSYDQDQHVAYYYREDGGFEMDDFAKGLHLIRGGKSGICYLIAVGALNQTSMHDFEKMLGEPDGVGIELDPASSESGEKGVVLPGEITDVSFIPERAQKECMNGYKWFTLVPDTSETRLKRQSNPGCFYYILFRPCKWIYRPFGAVYRCQQRYIPGGTCFW